MVTEALDKIAALRRKRTRDAMHTYQDVLAGLVREGTATPSPETVDEVLNSTGKTIADLERDLKLFADREHHREVIAEFEALQEKRPGIEAQVEKENKRFEKLVDEHEKRLAPLEDQLSVISRKSQSASNAQLALDKFRWPEFDEEREELAAAVADASAKKDKAQKHLREMESRLSTESIGTHPNDEGRRQRLNEYVSNAKAALESASNECEEALKAQKDFIERMRQL
ncbi:MAG: hypothetical protein AAGD07_10315 [Planctomycetota bacterium]